MDIKPNQSVRVTTRKGEVKTGTVVAVKPGKRGDFVEVKHADGSKNASYRPSALSA